MKGIGDPREERESYERLRGGRSMKIKIDYEYDPSYIPEQPYWAKSGVVLRCGASFAEAREKLVEHFRRGIREEIERTPESEEVEI